MMDLRTQLISFFISFIYGIFISYFFIISYKYLFYVRKIYKMLNSFLFNMVNVFLYFKIYLLLNNGIIHIYFILITIFTSYIFVNNYLQKKCKNKSD